MRMIEINTILRHLYEVLFYLFLFSGIVFPQDKTWWYHFRLFSHNFYLKSDFLCPIHQYIRLFYESFIGITTINNFWNFKPFRCTNENTMLFRAVKY